jgi:hypothetical protein
MSSGKFKREIQEGNSRGKFKREIQEEVNYSTRESATGEVSEKIDVEILRASLSDALRMTSLALSTACSEPRPPRLLEF